MPSRRMGSCRESGILGCMAGSRQRSGILVGGRLALVPGSRPLESRSGARRLSRTLERTGTLAPRRLAPCRLASCRLASRTLAPRTLAPRTLAPHTLAQRTLALRTLAPRRLGRPRLWHNRSHLHSRSPGRSRRR
jgi:hypothetical protein